MTEESMAWLGAAALLLEWGATPEQAAKNADVVLDAFQRGAQS